MERIIYRNGQNQEVEFSYFSPYILEDFTDALKNNVVTVKHIADDGYIYASSNLDARDLRIKGAIVMMGNHESLIRRLYRTFNPKLPGKIIYESEDVRREIEVVLDGLPQTHYKKDGTVSIAIDLRANDPYWTETEKTEVMALLSKQLTFPMVIPQGRGVLLGLRKSILETPIENIGDVATGFRVQFRAKGEVRNVLVENKKTGEKIKVNVIMNKGDVVEIINTPLKKMILINGERSFRNLDVENDNDRFFDLAVGTNLIGYNADLNAVNLDVVLLYRPLYLGR